MLMFVKIDSTPSNGSRFSAKKPQNSIMIINFELHRAQAFFFAVTSVLKLQLLRENGKSMKSDYNFQDWQTSEEKHR